ncbi:MAG: hypothetical protein ACQES0_01360 [Bacteroidota bacterium]
MEFMLEKTYKILLLSIIMLVSMQVNSQNYFSEEHEEFLKSFSKSIDNVKLDKGKEGKILAEQLEVFWASDSMSMEEKDDFIETANLLVSKGGQNWPHLFIYAENMLLFYRHEFNSGQYAEWRNGLSELLNERQRVNSKKISEYQFIANDLLRDSIIFRHPRVIWKVSHFPDNIGYNKDGLYVRFSNVDITGYHNKDSIKIYKTSGTAYPLDEKWEGQHGKVTWERVGMSPDSVYAELEKYSFEFDEAEILADSARFVNLNYFGEPLYGQLNDKAGNLDRPVKSSYPRFKTYTKRFEMEGVLEGIDYEGGFTMKGERFIGTGVKDQKARISIAKSDSIKLIAQSEAFTLDNKQVFSDDTEIILYLNEDSIYHPSLIMRYTFKNKVLNLQRDEEGMSKVYFTNSYHQLHMDFTWLQWEIEKYKMQFGMLKSMSEVNEAYFESADYFSDKRYQAIQITDDIHPFVRLEDFVGHWGSPEFNLIDFARYINYSPHQVKRMILRLAYLGFIHYDTETEDIKIKPEMYKYLDARRGQIDYDVLQFSSRTQGRTPNATLSLLNYDLQINGVPSVHISDSQNVEIYPIDKKIVMKKNRDFLFTGTMKASQFFFYGHEFQFDYEDFMVNMDQCDSMKMLVETGESMADGGKILKEVKATIENVQGEFFIDEPGNKSGLQEMASYPKFNSKKEAYVYYDDADIYDGVYHRNEFFFKIDPYSLDSLHGYERENLQFEGTFYSADIFPDIKETLVVRPDYSLGFHRITPDAGYPCYKAKGTYTRHVDLSNQGLRGSGRVEYLNSTSMADKINFFPDSLIAHATKFETEAKTSPVEYPRVEGENNNIRWYPYEDEYFVETIEEKFVMFEDQSQMTGELKLTPTGLEGSGMMDIGRSKLSSDRFTYERQYIDADTADFELFTENQLDLDFSTMNVNAHIDFPERKGHFKTNGDGTYVTFPKNDYIGYMQELVWHMDQEYVDIKSDAETVEKLENDPDMSDEEWENLFLEGPKFISIHPDQDSLNFVAPVASYDLENYIITAKEVKFLRVADATIYTGDGEVVVEKDAIMRPLKDAEIIANTTNRYHNIKNATVNIQGRKSYTGYGDYDYVDKAGQIQTFHLNRIGVDKTGQTYGEGSIAEPDDFSLSPNFRFQGDVMLSANKENLYFDGGTKIKHECPHISSEWLAFEAEIDPEDVAIPVDSTPVSINGSQLAMGLNIYRDSSYVAMYSLKERRTDFSLFMAAGYLIFDDRDMSYKVANEDKLQEESLPGNLLRFGRVDCTMNGSGLFSFSDEFGLFKPNPIGKFSHNPEKDTSILDLSLMMDFHFNDNAMEIMAQDINQAPGLTGTDLSGDVYEQAVLELLGQETAEEWFAELSMGNLKKMPKEMENLKILTDIRMKWYKSESMFIHEGPVGVSSLARNPVNRNVFSFIALEKNRRGDTFHMYFELDEETWYYFRYNSGNMAAISSNQEFNEAVYDTRPGQRLIKASGDKPSYRYSLGSKTYMRRFLKDMNELFGYDED